MSDGHDDGWDSRLSLRVAAAQQAYDDMATERDAIEARLREAGELLQALKTVQRLEGLAGQSHTGTNRANPTTRERLAQMAMEDADRLVRTNDVSQRLADLGVFQSKQDASKTIFSVLKRAPEFNHEGPGLYRYIGAGPFGYDAQEESA